jgi:hypothetical protein
MRPKVFIGSSSEGLKISQFIQVLLDKSCEVTVWSQGVFGLNQGTLESLVLALDKFDFAILVLTPDDMTISREQTSQSPRDNVLFELGLFVGGIGRDRTFIVFDRSKQIKIPSDLAGITFATFQEHNDGNLFSSLGAPTTLIQNEIERLGIRDIQRLKKLSNATDEFELTNDRIKKLIELLARSRKVELDIIANQLGPMINKESVAQIRKDLDDLKRMTE